MTSPRWTARMLALGVCALVLACGRGGTATDSPSQGAAPASPIPTAAPTRPKIVVLGDSLTAGLGVLESQAYPGVLQQLVDAEGYGFEVVNAGVSGDTSAGGLRRLDWALQGDVSVLIVALGANDGLRGLSVGEMKRNLSAIIERARARNIVVILAGMEAPPNYGQEYATAFRQAFGAVAREENVIFLPFLLDKVAGRSGLNQADGIHPNPEGARIVADNVWTVLRPVLDQLAAAR